MLTKMPQIKSVQATKLVILAEAILAVDGVMTARVRVLDPVN
jgi:hypothetical protein